MPTKSISRDRGRISSQSHELSYAGKKIGKNGRAAVVEAKKSLGHTTSRTKVMARARSIASKQKRAK